MRYLKLIAILFVLPWSLSAKTLTQIELTTLGTRAFQQKAALVCPQAMFYSLKECEFIKEDGELCMAVLHFDQGFLIISAEDAVLPVLAYGFEQDINLDDLPPAVELFLNQYKQEISAVRRSHQTASARVTAAWEKLRHPSRDGETTQGVAPLLTSKWNQGKYYNYYSPVDEDSPGGYDNKTPSGCVAIAMAQIMNYYRFPQRGSGSHTNYSEYGAFHVDFSQQTYNYDVMFDQLNFYNNEVSKLIFHCATAVDMMYGSNGSGAYSPDVPDALSTYFYYSPNAHYTSKHHYSYEEWCTKLMDELDLRRPVYYSGYSEEGGHAFVCDGYDSDSLFHFNFGWGGSGDGFYLTDNSDNDVNGYSDWQSAIFYIYPNSNDYPAYCSDRIIDALNGTLEDGSGHLDYQNNAYCTYVITHPQQYSVRVNFRKFATEENHDYIRFWNGHPSQDSLLLELSGNQLVGTEYELYSDSLYITFETDDSVTDQGWRFSFESMREGYGCGTHMLHDPSGTLTDNSEEGCKYRANSNCTWTIRITNASYIKFVFEELDISPEDHLDFYDISAYPHLLVASVSGNTIPEPKIFYSNRVRVNFVSDNYLEGEGFRVSWFSSEVGVEDFQSGQPTIYPNPVSDMLHIKFDEVVEQGTVAVYDMIGNLLFSQSVEYTQQMEIPVNQLTSGIYLLSFESQETSIRQKIVVKH